MSALTIITYYIIALCCYDLLKNFLKRATKKYWWKYWFDTPHRLWFEWKVIPDRQKHWKGTKSCENCCKSYRKSLGMEGWEKPKCKRFQNKLRSEWTNRYKSRDCKDFDRITQ